MKRAGVTILASALLIGAVVPAASQQTTPGFGIALETVGSGFQQPVLVTAPPDDARLFVVDQPGRIFIIADGQRIEAPFLDLRSVVGFGGERGLLGLAFHPDYAGNGRFFVNYTNRSGDTQIVEFKVSADSNLADPSSARVLLAIAQPAGNHNGGWLAFGPDGYLYIGTGDGGGAGDTFGNGQNRQSLLAKILRIDVDHGDPYAIPTDNPFAAGGGAPEAFLVGLRNPWRSDFDGDLLYIADVGQNQWEEIDVVAIGDAGANLGWSVMEGQQCFRGTSCPQDGLVLPVYEYAHSQGCSITGGYVYRGRAIPGLVGSYLFGDYCQGWIRSFRYDGSGPSDLIDWTSQLGEVGRITSFGEDAAGELYVTLTSGQILKIVPAP